MANTNTQQVVTDIFSHHLKRAAGGGTRFAVRQDKGRIKSARSLTDQPAPRTTQQRPTQPHRTTSRSANTPPAKQHTVHLTLWVNPIVKEELQRIAKREGLTVSKVGASFLQQAIQTNVDLQYSVILQPVIENAIRKEMAAIRSRLAWLLVRVAFDSGQTRSLVTNILGRMPQMTDAELQDILDKSQLAAKGNITRKSPQLTALMAALEAWLDDKAAE
jgi:hypothetical protein